MTKEITKSIILQEIQDKFKLRELSPAKFLFEETVMPVYDIERHLRAWHSQYKEVSITSGPTGFLFFTVPDDERWTMSRYKVLFMAAGAYKVGGCYCIRRGTPAVSVYLDLTKNQTDTYLVTLGAPIILSSGDELWVYVDDYTSTAALRLYIDYEVEEIR